MQQESDSLFMRWQSIPGYCQLRSTVVLSALYPPQWSLDSTNRNASSAPTTILQNGQKWTMTSGSIRKEIKVLGYKTSIF